MHDDGRAALRWFEHGAMPPARPVRLLCFPHAGASAYIFRGWGRLLGEDVGVVPMQLPGRGERLREPPVRRMEALLQQACAALLPLIDEPFALFGHSVGALIAFELARRLESHYGRAPRHLFVSGRGAPDRPSRRAPVHHLPTTAFVEALKDYSPTIGGLLEHAEALELFMPILRADLELVETYEYMPGPPLSCPITAFGGEDDDTVAPGDLAAWQAHTTRRCALHVLAGNHFFVTTNPGPVVDVIADVLRNDHD